MVGSADETLSKATDESYSLAIGPSSTATARAPTVFGALHALETFSQLAQLGSLSTSLYVEDRPLWPHRGLMVDAARRFLPLPLLRSIIDGLAYSKMNVLHMHLTDEPAARFESKVYPELTAHLPPGTFYTQADLKALIAYAKGRGVRIIAELDVPAHAGGLRPLEAAGRGLSYCDKAKTTLASDAKTLAVVDKLFEELATIFEEEEALHFGADEACKHDVCPEGCSYEQVHALEKHVQATIKDKLGKTPMGWNDVFSDPKASAPNAAAEGTLIQNWGKQSLATFAGKGFSVLDSNYQQMYLQQQCCRGSDVPTGAHDKYSLCFYRDSGAGLTGGGGGGGGGNSPPNPLRKFMDGGEVAMWSDNYCPAPHCAINGTYGWMYDSPAQDAVFSESFGNVVFPGTASAAGSLWNWNSSLAPHFLPSTEMQNAIDAHTRRLTQRNVRACQPGCACDWDSSCLGNASSFYAPSGAATPKNVKVTLTNGGCPFKVHVKARTPCSTLTGHDLVPGGLALGETGTVAGSDFILSGLADHGKTEKDGDQFSTWVGDGTWMNVVISLNVTCDDTTYISMVPVAV